MAVTALCTQANVEAILSQYGVEASLEDNADGMIDATVDGAASDFLEKASADVCFYLFQRYEIAAITASAWAKWTAAIFCARDMMTRRGNPCPDSLQREYDKREELLKAIALGTFSLPGDTGLANPQFDESPTVSNMTVDGRYHRRKVRRVPTTSTGGVPQGGVQQINANEYYLEN